MSSLTKNSYSIMDTGWRGEMKMLPLSERVEQLQGDFWVVWQDC